LEFGVIIVGEIFTLSGITEHHTTHTHTHTYTNTLTKEYHLKSHRVPDVWSRTITYKMFEGSVGSQLIIELKIREKNEAAHALKRRTYALEENIIRRARSSR